MNYKSQTVSAIVITHNDGATLEQCLYSLHWVDELIVVDCGSTDSTLSIARMFTDKVYFHPSRNLTHIRRDALARATSDWLLLVEPDEWVEEMLKHEIDGLLLNTNQAITGYTIPRRLKFQGQWITRGEGSPERFLRMVRKGRWQVDDDWQAALRVEGEVSHLDRPLGYAPYAGLDDLFMDVNQRSTLAAYRHLEEKGLSSHDQSLMTLVCGAKWAAFSHYVLRGSMMDGHTGAIMAVRRYAETFLKFAKIRALTRKA